MMGLARRACLHPVLRSNLDELPMLNLRAQTCQDLLSLASIGPQIKGI